MQTHDRPCAEKGHATHAESSRERAEREPGSSDELGRDRARGRTPDAEHRAAGGGCREYVEAAAGQRDEDGHALVVRNGTAPPRQITTGAGTMEVEAPRVHDRRDDHRFSSQILPPYMRKSPKVAEVLPILYLRGLSTGDFREALP
ncbi:MAG: hypothetical protein GY725_00810, partial [bacterium]|nr:hypothetical protein [bacterium]